MWVLMLREIDDLDKSNAGNLIALQKSRNSEFFEQHVGIAIVVGK